MWSGRLFHGLGFRLSCLFHSPSSSSNRASQESKMWFSGGRILAIGVRNVLAACANLAICPLKCPTHIFYTKFSFPSLIFQYSIFPLCNLYQFVMLSYNFVHISLFQRSHGQKSFACHKVHLQNRSWSSNHWSSNVQCQCPMLFAITCWCQWNPIKYFERKPHRYLSEIMIEISNRM